MPGKHDNVVRYYSAWLLDDHMLIQNELNHGIQDHLGQSELKIMPMHDIEGLRNLHSNDLVHMVHIKPQYSPMAHKQQNTNGNGSGGCGKDSVYEELRS